MKCIRVPQPWASAAVCGAVHLINMRYPTPHRGQALILATEHSEEAWEAIRIARHNDGYCAKVDVMGAVIGVVDVVGCDRQDECGSDLAYGPWCWMIEGDRMFREPIPWSAKGRVEFDLNDSGVAEAVRTAVDPQVFIDEERAALEEEVHRNQQAEEERWRAQKRATDNWTGD